MPYVRKSRTARRKPKSKNVRAPAKRKSYSRKRRAAPSTLGSLSNSRSILAKDRPQRQVGPLPFAREYYVRLPYADSFQQSAATSYANQFGVTTWNLASLYDPDVSGIGHQPMMYDQLTGIYRKYWVYGCKVQIEYSDPSADHLFLSYCVRTRNLAGVNGKTISQATEQRNCKVFPMVNTGSQKKTVSFYVDLAKAHGIPKIVFKTDEEQYAAAYNASPAGFCYLEIGTASTNNSAVSVNIRLRLTYFARMYDYLTQSQS